MSLADRAGRRAPRAASGLLVLVTLLPGCGGAPAARHERAGDDAAWRQATVRRLHDLRAPGGPYTRFMVPSGSPALVPLAESVIALDRAGEPVPGGARFAVAAFWDDRTDTFQDPHSRIPALVGTWLGLRATAAGADRAGAAAAAVGARIVPGGAAWEPGQGADPVATLYAARILSLAQGAGARVDAQLGPLREAAGCPRAAGGAQWDVDLAVAVETARLLSASCPLRTPRPAAVRAALRLARGGLGGAGLPSVDTVERIRALGELERAGIIPAGATAPLVAKVAAALHGARGGAMPGATAVRGAADLVEPARLRLGRSVEQKLQRDARWQGTLPDEVRSADPLETAMGAAALRMSGDAGRAAWVRWHAPGMRRGERALLALAMGPERMRGSDVRSAMDAARSTHGLRELAIAALAVHDAPAACPRERAALASTMSRLDRELARLETAPPTTLYWLGLMSSGAAGCAPAPAARLRAGVAKRLADVRRPSGVYGTAASKAPDLMSTWAGLETDCLMGSGGVAPSAALKLARAARIGDGGARTEAGAGFSVLATFASLRIEQLASGGCDGGWLARRPGGATLRLLRP